MTPSLEMPQEEGWYWYRPFSSNGGGWRPVRVWWEEKFSMFVADTRAGNCNGEWGPKIEPPEE